MSKIAVIFQGIGYNVDRPLLYYSKKIATEHGYEVKDVTFNSVSKECFNNDSIKWNFTKFLVNRMGQVVDRFEADAGTEIIRQAVRREINS